MQTTHLEGQPRCKRRVWRDNSGANDASGGTTHVQTTRLEGQLRCKRRVWRDNSGAWGCPASDRLRFAPAARSGGPRLLLDYSFCPAARWIRRDGRGRPGTTTPRLPRLRRGPWPVARVCLGVLTNCHGATQVQTTRLEGQLRCMGMPCLRSPPLCARRSQRRS